MIQRLNKLKLGVKLNLLLLVIFTFVITISGLFLSVLLEQNAEQVVADQAAILIETMSAVRQYTSTQIRPELADRLESETTFLPQTVPAYSAQAVFAGVSAQSDYQEFAYREAVLNPTNPKDLADEFEASVINTFRADPTLAEKIGFRTVNNSKLFYVARPIAVSEESCLECHSVPERAPESQILTYGTTGGYGWQLNEIVGSQILTVPATQVFDQAQRLQFLVVGSLIGLALVTSVILNFSLNRSIIHPIQRMSHLAQQVSTGSMSISFQHQAEDEIGILARSLNRMKVSLKMAMDMLNKSDQG